MSKLYDKYLELKKEDKSKYYLFKSGLFYIFIAEDALEISKITTLKATKFTEEIYKCGFPTNALDKYLNIFEALGKEVVIIDNSEIKTPKKEYLKDEKILKFIKRIEGIDTNKLTPMASFNLLIEFKEVLNNE